MYRSSFQLNNTTYLMLTGSKEMADRFYMIFVVVLKESSFNQIVFELNKIQVAPGTMDWQCFSYLGKWNLPVF